MLWSCVKAGRDMLTLQCAVASERLHLEASRGNASIAGDTRGFLHKEHPGPAHTT